MASGELHALGIYLKQQLNSHTFVTVDFDAAGRKHADSIVLQDYQSGYGDDDATLAEPLDFRECRTRRGSPEFWRHNENAEKLPGLVSFVDRALRPFFQSTGKVTILLSQAGDVGIEHVDHKFHDWVSEFIWLQTGVGAIKQLYVRDAAGDKRYAVAENDACCVLFDDHHSHSFDTIDEACYSVRVDGCFTEEFRKLLCTKGTFWSNSSLVNISACGGLRDVLQSQGSNLQPLSAKALQSKMAAMATAHEACDDGLSEADTSTITMLRNELKDAHRQISKFEEVLKRTVAAPSDKKLSFPTYFGPPQGLTKDSLFGNHWIEATRPLYELQMGMENMAPLLYSILRFHKPVKVLEVGAGFTTIFALQALHDNDGEIDAYQQLCRGKIFEWPKLNWVNEGYLQRSGGYRRSQLYCVNNMAHTGTTARLVSTVATSLGLEDLLTFIEGDAVSTETCISRMARENETVLRILAQEYVGLLLPLVALRAI